MSDIYAVVLTIDSPKSTSMTIHVVPTHWIVNDMLFYPPNKFGKTQTEGLIKAGRLVPVDKNWKKYACVIKRLFKSYDAANKYLNSKTHSDETDSEADNSTLKKLQKEQTAINTRNGEFVSFFFFGFFIFFLFNSGQSKENKSG